MFKRTVLTGFIFLTLSGLIFALASCSKTSQENPTTYTIGDPIGDWGYPSPYSMYPRGPSYIRMSFIFDTLIWKDKEGVVPALAEKWEYLSDETAYRFHLRSDVTFHDGQPFTADDVVFTFSYIKEHPWVWVDSSLIKKVEKISEHKVKIYLSKVYAPFLSNIAGVMPILPRHIWKGIKKPEDFKEKIIGTGPYRLIDYNRSQGTYLYEAYEGYYLGKPAIDRLIFLKISEEVASTALKRGEVKASSIPPEIMEYTRNQGLKIEEEPPNWAAKLVINHQKAPLSSKEFRQALAYAINRAKIVQVVKRGHAVIGNPGLVPPSNVIWHNREVAHYNYNTEKAKDILKNLGYRKGKNGYYYKDGQRLEFELLIGSVTQQEFIRTGEMLKKDLEAIGIKIELKSLEAKTADARIGSWKFDLAISGHGGLSVDPEILRRVTIENDLNSARYFQSKELISLLEKQVHQMNQEERKETVFKIQKIYAEELPAITLYYPKRYWAHDGTVDLYHSKGGLAIGIPIPLNKLSFLKRQ